MRFENKVMVITEAAQGIGKAVAEQVAREGARLALIDRAPYRITEIPHLVHEGKVKAYYIMGEDPLQTEADLSPAAQRRGRCDVNPR